jgi:two-component system chemotaxis response regulator CheB
MTPPLVVIGSSLGGTDAIRAVLRGLPPRFPAAVAVVQHRLPNGESHIVELFGAACALPVAEPDDRDPIVASRVYLAPAGYHLMIDTECFSLSTEEPVLYARPSIDVLFETAAESLGPRVAGVLLTASSEDGAAGIAAIWRRGGTTILQDPKETQSDVAVVAALALHEPTHIVPVGEIAELLCAWCSLGQREQVGEAG